jgi:protein ImuB
LACGEASRLRPRRVEERLEESMGVGDASSGEALKRVLGVLVDRLLARPERRGRTLRAATLSALLLAGGGWRERVVFRQALCDPERIWLALSLRLLALPAPAAVLRLSVDGFGPPVSDQGGLFERESSGGRPAASPARAARLREAVAQMRAVAGQDAALRAVCVDPDSRVPERRVVLAPIPD